ncbi:MAG TPA: pyridoxine 5'-phosphate synthase [Pirellulaceae bacterium]|nr:pyridoxine 5'-phosphate synthase [Pirellulaceae bacterium]
MASLGVNIDHVATIRQARQTNEPDPVWAAALAELGGADQITIHLREDRRHIQDRDVRLLKETVRVRLNLECALSEEMLVHACQLVPDQVCLVPERREEVTTEGGLDVVGQILRVRDAVARLNQAGISVSLFIDPESRQIEAAADTRAQAVELHTGCYANAWKSPYSPDANKYLETLGSAGQLALESGLALDAGHGLTYRNVVPIASIPGLRELNIGHSIVSRAVLVGMVEAVREMKRLIS